MDALSTVGVVAVFLILLVAGIGGLAWLNAARLTKAEAEAADVETQEEKETTDERID